MNHIVLGGSITDAAIAANTDKPCCRATLTFSPLQEGHRDGVLQLVAWGRAAEDLAAAGPRLAIVQGRLTLVPIGGREPTPTIEMSRLHHAGDGAVDGALALNSISLVGRAGRDPECRFFESGAAVANLTLAVNRGKDRDPDWFNLEIWGKQAQVAADHVRKGSLIGVVGAFKLDTWTDRASGEQRFKPVVRVDRLELLGSKRDGEQGGAPAPAQAPAAARRNRPAPAAPVWDGSGGVGDDVPF